MLKQSTPPLFAAGSATRCFTVLSLSKRSGSHTCRNTSWHWDTKAKSLPLLHQCQPRHSSHRWPSNPARVSGSEGGCHFKNDVISAGEERDQLRGSLFVQQGAPVSWLQTAVERIVVSSSHWYDPGFICILLMNKKCTNCIQKVFKCTFTFIFVLLCRQATRLLSICFLYT